MVGYRGVFMWFLHGFYMHNIERTNRQKLRVKVLWINSLGSKSAKSYGTGSSVIRNL